MTIELSDLIFTEQDDIVPQSGQYDRILNTYIANTLAGNDSITGNFVDHPYYRPEDHYGFKNVGVLNTDDGNDTIIGILGYGRFGGHDNAYNIVNLGTLNTGEGDDIIEGGFQHYGSYAVYNGIFNEGTLNVGEGNDTITGFGSDGYGFVNNGTLNTEDGNDIITALAQDTGAYRGPSNGFRNNGGTLNTGEGNDTISGYGSYGVYSGYGILNFDSTINTGNGDDSIISGGSFINSGGVFLGYGNDSITSTDYSQRALENYNFIGTGDGNDIITSTGVIYNQGIIDTGNGDDSIIVEGGIDEITGNYCSIYNNGGNINTGDGNDSIIASAGFLSGENSSGAWFLGEGEDYIKGFGSGDFYGGNGNDTLELTPGTYTVGIWGEGGESPIFTKGNQLMITSQFETLIAGGITYNFASLTAGQIITVAEV
jgi:hypothetical protein